LRSLVVRDLKVKYQRSMLGLIWTLLNPLLTVTIFIAIFTHVIRIQMNHYWAFLISGFFVWNFIQQSLYHATSILRDNASLNRSVYFPREILILSAALSKFAEFLVEIAIVLAALAVFHHHSVPTGWLALPLMFVIQVILTLGLMLPLAVVSVLFYDVQQAIPVAIMSLFYLSPVFYSVDLIPSAARSLYYLNPLVGLLEMFHIVIYQGTWPPFNLVGSAGLTAIIVNLVGYAIFKRYRQACVEIA
jgi:lipopolysaccharide transport system permease protein